jgi:ATP-dependent DNA ligase
MNDAAAWVFEFKYDGFRALLYFEQGRRCEFVSRNGNTLTRFDKLPGSGRRARH